ncbi:hypothetical protein HA402_007238 [Bradysia odoriphaga]|nr:hypothetical protein HA402_007238 [Bradysia odoriphaga]
MNSAVDPWVITSRERVKYLEQFKSLQPINGIVTGQQARGFFLQSQLPPLTLGQIWALADTDSDGKMNIDEFSIACKLINLKLRGFEVPAALPPVLIASLSAVGGTPTLTPTGVGSLSPLDPLKSLVNPPVHNAMPPGRPPMPMQAVLPQAIVPPMPAQQAMPIIPPAMSQPLIPGMGVMPQMTQPYMPVGGPPVVMSQPIMQPGVVPYMPVTQPLIQPTASAVAPTMGLDLLGNKLPSPVETAVANTSLPAPPTPPSGTPSRAMSISEKQPSLDSPSAASGQLEWAIKSQAKLKYTQLFNTTDRNRTGYLTGPQARNLLLQSQLPHGILAQIWGLADMDTDGRLGCEEFVLAMYLCDMATQGDPIPTTLPPELIPPSFRKSSRQGSITGVVVGSRHGSVSSQGVASVNESDPSAGLPGQTSFEDKRKENYDKGQAELDRRRKVLLDAQRKEQEERERKEREEADKREKARLEAERKQQEELERQLQRQREIEQEKEEKRKREIEQKEAARKEMEKQRQLEWEKQRIAEMQLQRQREQEKVLKLKAQNQSFTIELSTLNDKVKDLSQKICDTRAGVTNVKTIIDGMRSTRDTQMSDMAQLKARIKEQNQKLVHLSQEKAKMDSKSKSQGGDNDQAAFSNKQLHINQLKGKLDTTKEELAAKQADCTTNDEQLDELKTQLNELIETCEEIYTDYDQQRAQVMEMKNNQKNQSMTSAWDSTNAWQTETATTVSNVASANKSYDGYVKYRAIYEFTARNNDEITFQPGDIIMVPLEQNAEPGWFAGEINGHTGWFPESYVEKVESPSYEATPITKLQEIQEVAETIPAPYEEPYDNGESENYIACYPYESNEIGDLVFQVGEHIKVTKKDGDWWTGCIGNRVGIFPSNYVQPETTDSNYNEPTQNGSTAYVTEIIEPKQPQSIADEAANQEEADTEVSEINTQPINDNYREGTYSRPMSTTSTTGRKQKGEVAQVIAPYEATSAEQLSLTRGQLIMIRKKTDSGWWEGELQARGRRRQIGWFPATYVKVMTSGRLSGRSTPVSGGKVQMNEAILDKVIALYPYKAQNDDELSFEKDDIISVLGRDEPEWWRGECQGLTGLFPSNYVGPFVTSGKKR